LPRCSDSSVETTALRTLSVYLARRCSIITLPRLLQSGHFHHQFRSAAVGFAAGLGRRHLSLAPVARARLPAEHMSSDRRTLAPAPAPVAWPLIAEVLVRPGPGL
jgi:hypothetical protein